MNTLQQVITNFIIKSLGENMERKIVITSGKGGVGKTTITANLGMRLSMLGVRVVLIDLDLGLNNLDVVMNIENKIVYDIADVIEGKCRLKQALIQDIRYPALFVLPSNHLYTNVKINSYNIQEIVEQLSQTFDYILIDCPAGIDGGFLRAVFGASEALVVTTPHISSIRDADKVLTILNSYNMNNTNIIVNRARGDLMMNGQMIDVKQIESLLKTDLIGVIPDDDSIPTNSCMNFTKNDGVDAFKLLAENIHYGRKENFNYKYKYKGLFGSFKRSLRSKL